MRREAARFAAAFWPLLAACGGADSETPEGMPPLDGQPAAGVDLPGTVGGAGRRALLTGVWTVTGHALAGVAAMDESQASAWHGRTIRLVDWEAQAPGARCADPAYRTVTEPAEIFVGRFDAWPPDLVLPVRAGSVEVMTVGCGGEAWTEPGSTMIRVDRDRALTVWDGVFFTLDRNVEAEAVDIRGTGNEPGWLLEIDEDRRIHFLYDYGEAEVYTPVPDPRVDPETGVVTYHAVTESAELEVRIAPDPCTDDMSGFAYPATVEVTLGERSFRGCGGPAPTPPRRDTGRGDG